MKTTTEERSLLRTETVDQLARDIFQRRRTAVIAGDKNAIRDLSNGLLEELVCPGTLAALLTKAFTVPAELAGLAFRDAMMAVARRQAEEEAEAMVAAAERAASSDPETCTPTTRKAVIALDWMKHGA